MKNCRMCGVEKPPTEFYGHRETADGLHPYCKSCHKSASSARRTAGRIARGATERQILHAEGMRTCTQCGVVKPSTGEHFLVRKGVPSSPCRECFSLQRKAAYVPHPRDPRGMHVDPEKRKAKKKRRKALERGATISDFTAAQWVALKEAYDFSCAYCGGKVAVLTQDHVLALSKGGAHTAANIVPACQRCNSMKSDRPVEYILERLVG